MIKIDFCMIIFNGDYVLKQNLESIYPFANKIIITEGPISHYQSLGFIASTDNTVDIIKSFPDPENKIHLIRGQWSEKDAMCKAQEKYYSGDYVWHVDSDELYKAQDMENIINYLEQNKDACYSMSFRLYSFYGGFERYISGFEENFEVIRIQKIIPGQSYWKTHRPPTMIWPPTGKSCKQMGHISHFQSEKMFGVRIFHYPYVFPTQIKVKLNYYYQRDPRGIIPNYWERLYVPWMRANTDVEKENIERPTLGVQEWLPQRRALENPFSTNEAFTKRFVGNHPESIEKDLSNLNQRIINEAKILKVI